MDLQTVKQNIRGSKGSHRVDGNTAVCCEAAGVHLTNRMHQGSIDIFHAVQETWLEYM
jgi:hypothetical protein